ncbi:MAG: DUF2934 domain-containing protein [Gammaproteobacteria bacterium]
MASSSTPSPKSRSQSGAQSAPRRTLAVVPRAEVPAGMRHQMIELAAYLRAEQRGFQGGSHFEDWLGAEAEVDAILSERYR